MDLIWLPTGRCQIHNNDEGRSPLHPFFPRQRSRDGPSGHHGPISTNFPFESSRFYFIPSIYKREWPFSRCSWNGIFLMNVMLVEKGWKEVDFAFAFSWSKDEITRGNKIYKYYLYALFIYIYIDWLSKK